MEEQQDQKRRSGVWIVVVFLLLLVAYPASTGPFVWLHANGHMTDRSAEVVGLIYIPLGWAMNSVSAVGDAMIWYIDLWVR